MDKYELIKVYLENEKNRSVFMCNECRTHRKKDESFLYFGSVIAYIKALDQMEMIEKL